MLPRVCCRVGTVPGLPGEDLGLRDEMISGVFRRLEPQDLFEGFWADDAHYSQIEIRRLREMTEVYLTTCFHQRLRDLATALKRCRSLRLRTNEMRGLPDIANATA